MTPRSRSLIAAALATTLTVAVVIEASPSPASTLIPDHIAVLAGSPTRLVYADYPVHSDGRTAYHHGELHVLASNGHDRNLGAGAGNTDPADPDHYTYSIVGTTVTAYSPATPTEVKWWNLHDRVHGTTTLPAGATWESSAPGGWLILDADHLAVELQAPSGAVTSYGQPPANQAAVTDVVAGTDGFATVWAATDSASPGDPTPGSATYRTWANPGQAVPLDLGAAAASTGLSCTGASGVILGCVDRGSDGLRSNEMSIPLDGSAPQVFSGCGSEPVAVKSRLAWLCGAHKPRLWFGGSRRARSKAKVSDVMPVSAFGRAITTGPRQQAVISIRTASTPLHVLLPVPSLTIRYDDSNLRTAAIDVQRSALASGALKQPSPAAYPAQVLQDASDALIRAARRRDPSLQPANTRAVMGAVPPSMRHHSRHRPGHRHIVETQALGRFVHGVHTSGSAGLGVNSPHGGAYPAPFRKADGVYVDPTLAKPPRPTISMVALHSALRKLGQPYVWAAAGPGTFDCSGLTLWAYAHAGIHLTHYTGSQYNEGRLLKPKQVLPGDLILFDHLIGGREVIHHVGIYLGAGWMLNAPYTGQYVNIVRVPGSIAGIVRP